MMILSVESQLSYTLTEKGHFARVHKQRIKWQKLWASYKQF